MHNPTTDPLQVCGKFFTQKASMVHHKKKFCHRHGRAGHGPRDEESLPQLEEHAFAALQSMAQSTSTDDEATQSQQSSAS